MLYGHIVINCYASFSRRYFSYISKVISARFSSHLEIQYDLKLKSQRDMVSLSSRARAALRSDRTEFSKIT